MDSGGVTELEECGKSVISKRVLFGGAGKTSSLISRESLATVSSIILTRAVFMSGSHSVRVNIAVWAFKHFSWI